MEANGHLEKFEKFVGEWDRYRKESVLAHQKVDQMHTVVLAIHENMKHLIKLDTISETLSALSQNLIATLSGKNVIDINTAKEMMAFQEKAYMMVIRTLAWALGSIVALLLGIKLIWPQLFGG